AGLMESVADEHPPGQHPAEVSHHRDTVAAPADRKEEGQGVDREDEVGDPFHGESHREDEEEQEGDAAVGDQGGHRDDDGEDRGGGSDDDRIGTGDRVVEQLQKSAAESAEEVEAQNLARGNHLQEHAAEKKESQHIAEQMPET